MLAKFLLASSLLGLAATASAQCSLTVTGTGAPGTTVTFAIDGSSPGAFAFLAIGDTQGTTAINLGALGTLTLGLTFPFTALPVGMTNLQGDATLALDIPAGAQGSLDLFAQGVTLGVSLPGPGGPGGPGLPGLTWCTTNVAAFHIGS